MKKLFFAFALMSLLAAGCNDTGSAASPTGALQPPAAASPSKSLPPPATTQTRQNIVTYTDAGFTPGAVTVKKGETVIFKNSASSAVWVASNPHPMHNGYPTTGGCIASTFDSCGNIAPGQTWSFKFDIVGSWGYHNHLNRGEGGIIVVQ